MLKFSTDIDTLLEKNKDFESHYWFGGNVLSFQNDNLPGFTFYIGAYGDVRASLFDKKTREELVCVRDKRNNGMFYNQMKSYLKSDEELQLALDDNHPDYELSIGNNNWWECYAVAPDGEIIDLGDILNATYLSEAIDEVIDSGDDFIEYIKDFLEDTI